MGCLGPDGDSDRTLPPPAIGAPSRDAAAVTVRTWADFRCPHCATFERQVVPRLRRSVLGDEVRYEHHDFPVPVDRWSWRVASAARSVQARAGVEAFWSFAAHAFAHQSAMDDAAAIRAAARAADADPDAVAADVERERYRPVVAADRETGREAGVTGTPTVLVAGERVAPTYEAIASAVERER